MIIFHYKMQMKLNDPKDNFLLKQAKGCVAEKFSCHFRLAYRLM
jgi:hypothetical protein